MDASASINEVLSRPFLISDIHLSVPGDVLSNVMTLPLTTQPFISTFNLPSAILDDPNKMSKLEFFRYFTADMKIRLETNAQPYMSGKFWIFYNPYPELVTNSKNIDVSRMASLTSYPGIEYDLNQMSNGEISIPFISYERAFDLENPQDYCKLYISQLTNIRDITTETKLRMRVYGWFENVKVFGATSRSNVSRAFLLDKITQYNNQLNAKIQINTRKEQKGGIISQISSGVSQVAGALSGVPVIGSIASSVGWVSDIVGNVASIFGFSRPTSTEPVCKFVNVPGHGFTYSQNVDQSVILAAQPDNELGDHSQIFQTEVDEMDVEYICNNPGVIAVLPYRDISDNTSWLLNIPCSIRPYAILNDTTIGATVATLASPTCAEYLGGAFRYWRGTVCFKISLAKTPFHNGRLILSFDPSNSISDTPFSRIGKAYTTILDLSENSSIIVKIPYLSKFDYLNTFNVDNNPDYFSFGTFSIGALAPLLGPATVDTTVDVVVWKWLEDVELAIPSSVYNFSVGLDTTDPVVKLIIPRSGAYSWTRITSGNTFDFDLASRGNDATLQSKVSERAWGVSYDANKHDEISIGSPVSGFYFYDDAVYRIRGSDGELGPNLTASPLLYSSIPAPYYEVVLVSNFSISANIQINLMNRDQENTIIFNNVNVDNTLIHALDCIGEKITNTRTLLRMHRPTNFVLPSDENHTVVFTPFHEIQSSDVPYFYDNSNYVMYMSRIYRFYRGGFSYKIFNTDLSRKLITSSLNLMSSGKINPASNTPIHNTFSDLSLHEVRVPFYSQTYRRVISDELFSNVITDYTLPSVVINEMATSTAVLAGDDSLSYGWLVGPPVIAYSIT